jgi:hypothetical protein
MWCDYRDFFCLNPLCLGGCVDLENRRRHEEKSAEILLKALEIAAKKKD